MRKTYQKTGLGILGGGLIALSISLPQLDITSRIMGGIIGFLLILIALK